MGNGSFQLFSHSLQVGELEENDAFLLQSNVKKQDPDSCLVIITRCLSWGNKLVIMLFTRNNKVIKVDQKN